MAAAENLPLSDISTSISDPREMKLADTITEELVYAMNHSRADRRRLATFSQAHGEHIVIDLSSVVEERLFEDQQDLEAAGIVAQFENTFGTSPARRSPFSI